MDAITDARIEGVRTHHDIDVLVTFKHGGLDLMWIVECKRWKTPISKLHVLGLRQIIEDVGADRGILLAESGFQSGAHEAIRKSNVHLTSLIELYETASDALNQQKLLSFPERIARAHRNYWSLSKTDRIELGIRTAWESGDRDYMGQLVLPAIHDVLSSSLAGQYPPYGQYAFYGEASEIKNLRQAVDWIERELSQFESRLDTPEALARRRPDR